MKKILIAFASAAVITAMAVAPASAGRQAGTLVIQPDPVYQGGSTVISNADDVTSTCVDNPIPTSTPAAQLDSQVHIIVTAPDGETDIVETDVIPDDEGNWSLEVADLQTLGVYEVLAACEFPPSAPDQLAPANSPFFTYALGTFEVIAQQATTTVAPTTVAPTTTTTAGTSAVTATPKYTG